MNYSNHPATKDYRQLLRKTETPAERMLWRKIKGKQLDGYRFRQQHGYGPYVTDVDGVLNRVREYINKCITQGTAVVQTPTPLT